MCSLPVPNERLYGLFVFFLFCFSVCFFFSLGAFALVPWVEIGRGGVGERGVVFVGVWRVCVWW